MTATIDPFFEKIFGGDWNACVGIQGSELNYLDGYLEAAEELVSAVIEKNLVASRDTLVMPILFNVRHGIELSLKFADKHLHECGAIKSSHRLNHDIRSQLVHLIDADVGDLQIRNLLADLLPFVNSLANVDADGQELRYAENREGKASLNDISIVNLPHVRTSIQALRPVLERLKYRVLRLVDERQTESFTSRCSRRDLEEIADLVGDHGSWCDKSFVDKKRLVSERFGLSKRQFSLAIDKVRRSRALAALIGIETPLLYLADERVIFIAKEWLGVRGKYPPIDGGGIDFASFDRSRFLPYEKALQGLTSFVLSELTLEEFADLEVTFYTGRDRQFGELYEKSLADTVRRHRLEVERAAFVRHILIKTNFLESVASGCRILGRSNLAGVLEKM